MQMFVCFVHTSTLTSCTFGDSHFLQFESNTWIISLFHLKQKQNNIKINILTIVELTVIEGIANKRCIY